MEPKSEKPETRRGQQARESKDRIYETGIELFTEKGFDDTSIAEICRKAGCSVGAFYHHFSSKDAIIEEKFRRVDREVVRWGKAGSAGKSGAEPERSCGRDAVLYYMDSYANLVTASGLEFSKRFYTWRNKNFIKKGRRMQVQLETLLQRGIDSGELKLTLSAEEACEWLFVCARGMVFHWCLHEGSFDLESEMRKALDRALRGIEA